MPVRFPLDACLPKTVKIPAKTMKETLKSSEKLSKNP
jgi:hypothetical protein